MYAHQSTSSFNAAAKDVAVNFFRDSGDEVEVSDLYAMNFKATATAEDITGTCLKTNFGMWLHQQYPHVTLSEGDVKDPEHFLYAEETVLALQAGKLSADITEEQRKLKQADLVIFQVQLSVGQG